MGLDVNLVKYNIVLDVEFEDKEDNWRITEKFKEYIRVPSKINPDHICRVGYLRSSYNSAGFNSVTAASVGMDWYSVFLEKSDQESYHVLPNWERAREQNIELLEKLRNTSIGVTTVRAGGEFGTNPTHTKRQAMEVFLSKDREKFGFQDKDGTFLTNPQTVYGMIPGVDVLQKPCVHLIVDRDMTYYVEAAQISLEMIEYVLSQGKRAQKQYVLHWSG